MLNNGARPISVSTTDLEASCNVILLWPNKNSFKKTPWKHKNRAKNLFKNRAKYFLNTIKTLFKRRKPFKQKTCLKTNNL